MKRFLLASTALVMLGGSAFAADLPARMPLKAPIAVAPFSWTGCHLGGHIGGAWSHVSISDPNSAGAFLTTITTSPDQAIGIDASSVIGGAQVGCDYQFATNWVIGAAGDYSFANLDGDAADPFFTGKFGTPTLDARSTYLATATARLGYAWDRYLVYAKGGAAWTHNNYSISNLANFNNFGCTFFACSATASDSRLGWTVGGGFEWAFANSWSAFAEFDYYDFGTRTVLFNGAYQLGNVGSQTLDIKQHVEAVKVGLNYRFNIFH